jgi:hypothetical protein
MLYEVALVDSEEERRVLKANVEYEQLFAFIAAAFEEPKRGEQARLGAVLVSRMDVLPETWADRASLLVDTAHGTDKNGKPTTRRKVRYGKMSMREWDLLMRLNAWRPKPKRKVQKIDKWADEVVCRNGDEMCACLILHTTCRTQMPGQKVLASSIKGGS